MSKALPIYTCTLYSSHPCILLTSSGTCLQNTALSNTVIVLCDGRNMNGDSAIIQIGCPVTSAFQISLQERCRQLAGFLIIKGNGEEKKHGYNGGELIGL